jgi:type IV fimbrial biogenesis protein FimT
VNRMSSHYNVSGLSLIELMIVLLIVAISLSVGTPLMQSLRHKNVLSVESSRFLGAVNLARSESVKRNLPVSICPSKMAATGEPVCGGIYSGGWIVFANPNRDKIVNAETDEVLQVFEALHPLYTITNRAGTTAAFHLINYLPDGTSHSNRTLLFCPPGGVEVEPLSLVINIVGRARLARGWGECPVV